MKLDKLFFIIGLLTISSLVQASEYSHFKGENVDNLDQAVKVFSTQNKKFSEIIKNGNVSLEEMGQIHQITYSMENALRKIKLEVTEMEYLLENVHKASEYGGNQKVIEDGQKYLEKAQTLVP